MAPRLKAGLRRPAGWIVIALLALLGAGGPGAGAAPRVAIPAPAPPGPRTFAETGQTVSGQFRTYWEAHGGLAQQGFPIAPEFFEKSALNGQTYSVQYFERAVFELHPENPAPFGVLLSQLGTFAYQAKYPQGAINQAPNATNARVFSETGKTLGGKFRAYWESHGGLAQQGFPISNEFPEKSALDGQTYIVQYFERAVFELHPENAPPYDVLLSQLGTFQYQARYPQGPPAGTLVGRPVVDVQRSCLLGGSGGGSWLDAAAVAPLLQGGESYRLYGLAGALTSATGSKPDVQDPCSENQIIEIAGGDTAMVGVGGAWNAAPRVPRSESLTQAVYIQATAQILREHGLPNAQVHLAQVLRVDLEGDGAAEVLVSATYYKDGTLQPHATANDYSVVYLRKVINGQVHTVVIDGDFQKETTEFSAPITYEVAAVLDLNGDGVLEVVVHGAYYEGSWSSVYTVKGTQVEEVLNCGCGV